MVKTINYGRKIEENLKKIIGIIQVNSGMASSLMRFDFGQPARIKISNL